MNFNLGTQKPVHECLEDLGLPVYIVDEATHHVYFKNPQILADLIHEEVNTEREGPIGHIQDSQPSFIQ